MQEASTNLSYRNLNTILSKPTPISSSSAKPIGEITTQPNSQHINPFTLNRPTLGGGVAILVKKNIQTAPYYSHHQGTSKQKE